MQQGNEWETMHVIHFKKMVQHSLLLQHIKYDSQKWQGANYSSDVIHFLNSENINNSVEVAVKKFNVWQSKPGK